MDDRDYAGMYEIEPGKFVQRVHIYESDERLLAIEAKLDIMIALLSAPLNVKLT